jgi:hypothetical protein
VRRLDYCTITVREPRRLHCRSRTHPRAVACATHVEKKPVLLLEMSSMWSDRRKADEPQLNQFVVVKEQGPAIVIRQAGRAASNG